MAKNMPIVYIIYRYIYCYKIYRYTGTVLVHMLSQEQNIHVSKKRIQMYAIITIHISYTNVGSTDDKANIRNILGLPCSKDNL